jgi:hypothetical protein
MSSKDPLEDNQEPEESTMPTTSEILLADMHELKELSKETNLKLGDTNASLQLLIDLLMKRETGLLKDVTAAELARTLVKEDADISSVAVSDSDKGEAVEDATTLDTKLLRAGIDPEEEETPKGADRRARRKAATAIRTSTSEYFKAKEDKHHRTSLLKSAHDTPVLMAPLSDEKESTLFLKVLTLSGFLHWSRVLDEMGLLYPHRPFEYGRYMSQQQHLTLVSKAALNDDPLAAKITRRLDGTRLYAATNEEISELFYWAYSPSSKADWIAKLQATVRFKEMRPGFKYSYFTLDEFLLHLNIFLRDLMDFHHFCTMFCEDEEAEKKFMEDHGPPMYQDKGYGYVKKIQDLVPYHFLENCNNNTKHELMKSCKTLGAYVERVVRPFMQTSLSLS